MRTKIESHNRHGFVTETYVRLGVGNLPDDIEMMLGAQDLVYVEVVKKEGRTIYHAPEYECEWCGSYEHKSDDCPELEADDDIEEPYPGA